MFKIFFISKIFNLFNCFDKVPIDFYVMSKCPDAVICEATFLPVMEKIGDIVDLNINYISKENLYAKYGAQCMHGDPECLGNIQQLCVKKLYPEKQLQFINCLNKDYKNIGIDSGKELLKKCVDELKISNYNFDICINNQGNQLLIENSKKSIEKDIKTSCTIFINNGESKCVRDGEWKDCEGGFTTRDFVRKICSFYKGPKPLSCTVY